MSDVFKVYMYWTFEAVRSSEEQSGATSEMTTASLCRVRMGLRVDFLKMSMIKSQIFAGTKEELEVLSKQWERFIGSEISNNAVRKGKLNKKKSGMKLLVCGPHTVSVESIVNYETLFQTSDITKLHDCQFDATSSALWQVGWQKNAGYRKFLESEGDIEIQMSEWEPFNELVEKDLSKLTFHFRRTCTYLHPRTSMLMFGPKNATAQQVQYLHLPEWVGKETSHVTVENLNKMYPVSNAIVMSATQFEGIPMSDVFKVYMYWTFEAVRSSEEQSGATSEMTIASLCRVRMGLRVDFLKSTMLRSQIFAGTKEELEVLSKQWEQFQIDELEAHSKRQDLALLSNKGTVGVFTDSDDSDDDSDTDAVSKHKLIKEQVKAALIEHDKLRGSVVDNIWMPSPFLFGVIVLVLVLQFVLIFIMLRRMSTLSDMVEGLVASDKQCHTR
jgi:hypothetical protein